MFSSSWAVDLVISGAGSHGLTQAACLRSLSSQCDFKRAGGSSAGAINAAGLALGLDPERMVHLWSNLLRSGDVPDWKFPGPLKPLGLFQGRGGCMRGLNIRSHLEETLGKNTQVGEVKLPFRLMVGNMNRRRTEMVSSDLERHKHIKIVDAVMCSLAVPFLIDGQLLDLKSPTLYCDGGVGNNVPRSLWDDPDSSGTDTALGVVRPTLVLHFVDSEEPVPATDFVKRLHAVINIMRDAAEDARSKKPESLVWNVPIAADGDALNFVLTKEECARREKIGDMTGAAWLKNAHLRKQ